MRGKNDLVVSFFRHIFTGESVTDPVDMKVYLNNNAWWWHLPIMKCREAVSRVPKR